VNDTHTLIPMGVGEPEAASAMFDLEILDTATGAMVRCAWADEEAYRRSLDRPTVADRGVW
jgi:hypothetical protein